MDNSIEHRISDKLMPLMLVVEQDNATRWHRRPLCVKLMDYLKCEIVLISLTSLNESEKQNCLLYAKSIDDIDGIKSLFEIDDLSEIEFTDFLDDEKASNEDPWDIEVRKRDYDDDLEAANQYLAQQKASKVKKLRTISPITLQEIEQARVIIEHIYETNNLELLVKSLSTDLCQSLEEVINKQVSVIFSK